MPYDFDLVSIGSGPAGQRAAVQASKLGKQAAVIEQRLGLGGVCLETGTIPSKTFREAVISILAVIVKQERVRLSERTIAGLQRARARGRIGGRPRAVCEPSEVVRLKTDGKTLADIALKLKVSKSTVYRILQQSGKK